MSIFVHRVVKQTNQSGFSLIEVLVTMAIVAVGLMGLIALMLKGLQANSGSSMRTVATAQAYDMADRMRANLAGVLAGDYDSILPPGSASTSCAGLGAYVAPPTSSSLAACTTAAAGCSTACSISDVATRDKCAWHLANATSLSSGSGAVCKVAGNAYDIYISWDDDKSGNTNKTFKLRLEP